VYLDKLNVESLNCFVKLRKIEDASMLRYNLHMHDARLEPRASSLVTDVEARVKII
jgi:hypothetical protein